MELVSEWLPVGKIWKFYTPFRTGSEYKRDFIAAITMMGDYLQIYDHGYHGKFGHTIGMIKHIAIVIRIEI